MQLDRETLAGWVDGVFTTLADDDSGAELRKLSLRGHPTSSRMKGAEEVWAWEPMGTDLPPVAVIVNAAWAAVEAHGAESFKVVQGRAQLEGGGELPSKTWRGPGVEQEPEQTGAPASEGASAAPDFKTNHPSGVTRESELVHTLSVLVDHSRAQAQGMREMVGASVQLAKVLPPLVQGLSGIAEGLSRSLVKSRVAEAEAMQAALLAETEAAEAAEALASQEAESDILTMGFAALAEAALTRWGVGMTPEEKRSAALDALKSASEAELVELAKDPAVAELLPRVAAAYAAAQQQTT